MPLKAIIAGICYLLFMCHIGLIYAIHTQGLGWLLFAPLLIIFDWICIPKAIEDWNA